MAEQTLSVVLPEDIAADIAHVVAAGAYASGEDLVQDVLREWHENRHDALDLDNAYVRAKLAEADAAGPAGEDAFVIFERLEEKYRKLAEQALTHK